MARNNYKSGIDYAMDHLINATDELIIEAEYALIDTKAKEVIYIIEKIENYLVLAKQIINEKKYTAEDSTIKLDEHIIQLDATYSKDLLNYFIHEIPNEPMTIRQLLEFGLADIVLDGETIAYEEDLIVEVDIEFGPIGNVIGGVTNIVGDISLDTTKASINESTLNENEALYQFDLSYVDEVVNNAYYDEPGDIPRETVVLDLLKDAKRVGLRIIEGDLVNDDVWAVGTKEQFREFERTNKDVLEMKTPNDPYWIDEFEEEAWKLDARDLELTTFVDIDKEIRNLERQVK